ncbi:hypothetical protein CA54_59480 [Symmachiella macrocystis]|uniref:Uncharacterized protein n=1 Tax=Symmachiella macrocystis TaxID=2527985 RepID=A0A5C6AZW5_9PLAN|nr:hypothetical protein CA54_59480 [Symmachiella macrocystis]
MAFVGMVFKRGNNGLGWVPEDRDEIHCGSSPCEDNPANLSKDAPVDRMFELVWLSSHFVRYLTKQFVCHTPIDQLQLRILTLRKRCFPTDFKTNQAK